jgi:hypothetical protein
MKNPVSTEARIALRHFKIKVAQQSSRLHAILVSEECDALTQAFMFKSGAGRDRALARIKQLLPIKIEAKIKPRRLFLTALRCMPPLLVIPRDPGETQDAVCLEFVLSYFPDSSKQMRTISSVWTMEIPDHAIGRLFQRNPGVDAEAALYRAHATLLRAKFTTIPENNRDIYVESLGGSFAGNMIYGRHPSGDKWAYFRARTFLAADQLEPSQHALHAGTPSWGQTLLLPWPLLAQFTKALKTIELDADSASTPLSA